MEGIASFWRIDGSRLCGPWSGVDFFFFFFARTGVCVAGNRENVNFFSLLAHRENMRCNF